MCQNPWTWCRKRRQERIRRRYWRVLGVNNDWTQICNNQTVLGDHGGQTWGMLGLLWRMGL